MRQTFFVEKKCLLENDKLNWIKLNIVFSSNKKKTTTAKNTSEHGAMLKCENEYANE